VARRGERVNPREAPRWTPEFTGEEWDAFVEGNGGTPYQSWAFRSIFKDCGNDPEYLVYRRPGGAILAACPLFRVRVGKTRQRLMGPIYRLAYGSQERKEQKSLQGVLPVPSLFGPEVDLHAAARALQHYLEGFRFPPISSLDLMTSQSRVVESLRRLGFPHKKVHGDFITDLDRTPPEKIWSDVFSKHDRQAVKYFDRLGADYQFTADERGFREFLRLNEGTMLREGYTPITADYLELMRRHLGEKLQLALSSRSNELISGELLILDRANGAVYLDKIGYLRLRNIHSSVVALWFKTCQWAKRNGFRYVNFGGVRSEEAFRLKSKFGGEFTEYHMFVLPSSSVLYPVAAGLMRNARRLGTVVTKRT